MTREEAIELLEVHKAHWERLFDDGICDAIAGGNTIQALKLAIRALKKEQTGGDLINKFRDYQIEWLTSHNDIDLQETEMWVVQFLKDTAECFLKTELPSAEKTANKININEYVKVRLTDYGKEIFYHQYDDLNKFYGKEMIKPSYPTVDSDGYTSFQLWYFINLYGRYIDMGVQNVIEPLEIVFESAEKTAEWVALDDYPNEDWECDNCGYIIAGVEEPYRFCPNCGKKMWK